MIVNPTWESILNTASDLTTVVEIFDADATPTAAGFDPADALGRYTAIAGLTFSGETYINLLQSVGTINRTIGAETNSCSVTFDNLNREISDFEFATGFEGLIMVVRLISRAQSTIGNSQILFTGVCEKITSGSKKALTVTAKWILGGLDVQIPRRKYAPEDAEGRTTTDPEFEGFVYKPQFASATYARVEQKSGIAGFFGRHKLVWETMQYSGYSNLDAAKPVAEVFGQAQMVGIIIEALDVGTDVFISAAFCEGGDSGIYGYTNARSLDERMPINLLAYAEQKGLVGNLNDPDPAWLSGSAYSRLAYIRWAADNSAVETVDPAPDLAVVVLGRLMTIPDASGDWVTTDTWTDNAAAHTYFMITSPDYFKRDALWIDEPSFTEGFEFNAARIIRRSLSDFTFLVEG